MAFFAVLGFGLSAFASVVLLADASVGLFALFFLKITKAAMMTITTITAATAGTINELLSWELPGNCSLIYQRFVDSSLV